MTQTTYKNLIKMDKEYLIEFIRSMEKLPHMSQLETDTLSYNDIEKIDLFYDRWCIN